MSISVCLSSVLKTVCCTLLRLTIFVLYLSVLQTRSQDRTIPTSVDISGDIFSVQKCSVKKAIPQNVRKHYFNLLVWLICHHPGGKNAKTGVDLCI